MSSHSPITCFRVSFGDTYGGTQHLQTLLHQLSKAPIAVWQYDTILELMSSQLAFHEYASGRDVLCKLKVAELKSILKPLLLKLGGNKGDLIDRNHKYGFPYSKQIPYSTFQTGYGNPFNPGYGSGATSVGGGGYDSSSIGSLGGVRGYTSLQQAQQAQQHRSQAMPFSAGGVGFGQQGMLIPQMPIGGMAKNPFHDKIDFVLPETAVIAGLRSHGPQTTFTHTITITGEHLSKLNTPGLWGAAKFSAFLRCCYYNTKKKTWIDSWPRGVMFSLGGRPLRDDLIRPPRFRPTDITTELQQAARASAHSATAAIQCNFQITQAAAVTGANQNMANYVVSIFCASSSTPTSLTDRLRSSISPAEKCQQQIAEKLREQQVDADICVGRTFVSLKCPLSQCRISLPCKPSTCSHLQCFDLAFFLKMNERKPTWECPVCRGPAQFSTLEINGLFVKILAEAPTNAVDVEFDDSANWTYRSHEEKEKEEQATTEQRNAKRRRSSQALQGSSGVSAAGSTTGYSSGGGGGGGGGAAAASSSGARANSTVETGSSLDSLLNGSDAFFNDLIFGHGVARIEGSTGAGAAAGAAGAGTQDQPICLD